MNDFDITVLEFMREYPLTAQILRTTGEYDPAYGAVAEVQTMIAVDAILLDYTLQSNGMGQRAGTEIQAGDKQLFVRPPHKADPTKPILQVNPTTDLVRIGDVVYNVVTVKEINPTAADPMLYELQLRR